MAKKRNIESASVFERSGFRAIRARAIEVLLYGGILDGKLLNEARYNYRKLQDFSVNLSLLH